MHPAGYGATTAYHDESGRWHWTTEFARAGDGPNNPTSRYRIDDHACSIRRNKFAVTEFGRSRRESWSY
jgi:hypothetical protein